MGSGLEIMLVALVAALAAAAIVRAGRGWGRARWVALGAFGTALVASAALRWPTEPRPPDAARPRPIARGEYVSSNACRSCHPSEHASWHDSYHRTMTQDATPANVLAPLDGRPLDLDGQSHRFERRGDEIWSKLPDPDVVAEAALRGEIAKDAPAAERRVVLATGSHHEQAYWVAGRRPGELRLFPFVWMVREARWIPRRDAFLQPPDAKPYALRWNSNCIACHATGGRPGHDIDRDAFDTRVVELGIACEACHGPGGEHVRRMQDPVTRYFGRGADEGGDLAIVNPARLDPALSTAVCGQCHAYAYPNDEDDWWTHGYALGFRPGQTLARSRTLFTLGGLGKDEAPRVEAPSESLFWPDGAIRVGGREYNAVIESACHTRGEGKKKLTCLSCHAMHEGDRDDQLAPARLGDAACVGCHEGKETAEHSRHAQGGAGCLDCHMPPTTYALFKPIRSHRIDSPSVAVSLRSGRPNACNLCHLDRSLAWTQGYLERWYGAPHVEVGGDRAELSAIVVDALKGDAAQRVLAAAALGSQRAIAASGRGWQAPVLAELLVDPYAAVRFVAGRSLGAHVTIDYDFLAPPDARESARRAVIERFEREGTRPSPVPDARVVRALLAERDNRAITIAE
ncbi:ammonia-forming cytochrome c nitrite reductase subunit c552 [Polyangium aurulentum]|uniref:ammonia-forming cytochrome c nitrite reductase subunit c552 n=1 Tax=Polyangium aurulentum TaxID=2567896 RepID=UPI0010AE97E4|nr:ammonia-forming cytochrome c nitrite reductase subunit c552 [Polyangium aurulentum]UQA59709.1 ammonia-forming cytochrome c nitrite reductase subunit c552 [Polyangium aurulentum]